MRNRTAAVKLRASKFPGMTREQYDSNMRALLGVATRRAVFLNPRAANPMTAAGLPQFRELDDSAMYKRPAARGAREAARRLRQRDARIKSAARTLSKGNA